MHFLYFWKAFGEAARTAGGTDETRLESDLAVGQNRGHHRKSNRNGLRDMVNPRFRFQVLTPGFDPSATCQSLCLRDLETLSGAVSIEAENLCSELEMLRATPAQSVAVSTE